MAKRVAAAPPEVDSESDDDEGESTKRLYDGSNKTMIAEWKRDVARLLDLPWAKKMLKHLRRWGGERSRRQRVQGRGANEFARRGGRGSARARLSSADRRADWEGRGDVAASTRGMCRGGGGGPEGVVSSGVCARAADAETSVRVGNLPYERPRASARAR